MKLCQSIQAKAGVWLVGHTAVKLEPPQACQPSHTTSPASATPAGCLVGACGPSDGEGGDAGHCMMNKTTWSKADIHSNRSLLFCLGTCGCQGMSKPVLALTDTTAPSHNSSLRDKGSCNHPDKANASLNLLHRANQCVPPMPSARIKWLLYDSVTMSVHLELKFSK